MFSDGAQPVVGITWYGAVAYCEWLSQRTRKDFRLPTEAEWERAARGERVSALFPWGDAPPCERLQIGCDPETGGPARVGVNAPNDFGLHDMSEGVHEWCSDYYAPEYYGKSPERNPQGPSAGGRRVSRGGSWRHKVKFSRCAARTSLPPELKYADYGFRVALTL
jgi:formylglycine-generating enzyme required for sulfatase activity